MSTNRRLKIAIQKSGRLSENSSDFLKSKGLEWESVKGRLAQEAQNFPMDIMSVRDDDIPRLVAEGVCELGIVGRNLVEESLVNRIGRVKILRPLDFGFCRLSIAISENQKFSGIGDLNSCRIATSYPRSLKSFLSRNGVKASVVELSGSVEIALNLGLADAICDLVSTGSTLRSNGLKEVITIFESQALLIGTGKELNTELNSQMEKFLEMMEFMPCLG